ncbi:hypothetical protein ANN_10957 [Periplaneta americana]|uniref:HTH CENPB-type domain-containing protein n=1 Tax=Periplaneta americana TaxID=6978 RepID=A0ABQ8T5D3_PERAM|nr:hypothetical protein ANN_10957 [Periplaneta americana]
MPGKAWAHGFLQRHKVILSEHLCQNIKCSRAAVWKETLEEYFKDLDTSLAGVPPEVILNHDETNTTDDPGRKKKLYQTRMPPSRENN